MKLSQAFHIDATHFLLKTVAHYTLILKHVKRFLCYVVK